MAKAELTEELVHSPWLGGASARLFKNNLDQIRPRVNSAREPVLVAEPDATRFLAVFFAALLADRPVVLGNPAWGRQEWQQTFELTGARRIRATGEVESSLVSSFEPANLRPGNILIPTGGTTGRLRFARHSWETLTASADGFSRFFGIRPVNSVCVLPLFHVSGLMQVVRALVTGGEVSLSDWRAVAAGEIPVSPEDYFLSLVPSQLGRLLGVDCLHPWLRRARAILLGGAAAPSELLDEAARLCLPIVLSYGATESAAMVTAQKPGEFLSGDRSSGRPLPHVSVRIVDLADPDPGKNGEGQISISGSSLCDGYVPGESFRSGEWTTGDLGRSDGDQRLTVLGRADSMILTGGEKVLPGEVERVLSSSGLVKDVAVFGVPDAEWGQAVTAVYVSANDVTPDQLRATVRKELAAFKVPKHWVPVPEIPRTSRGKIDREWMDTLLGRIGL